MFKGPETKNLKINKTFIYVTQEILNLFRTKVNIFSFVRFVMENNTKVRVI